MPLGVYNKRNRLMLRVPAGVNLVIDIVAVINRLKLRGRAGEKLPLMEHPMADRPGLNFSDAGRVGISVDGHQVNLAISSRAQLSPGVIHNLRRKWAEGFAACVNERQHNLVAAQRREGYRMPELVGQCEIRRELARQRKAAKRVISRVRRLRGLGSITRRHYSDHPGSRDNDHQCRSGNEGRESQFMKTIRMPHGPCPFNQMRVDALCLPPTASVSGSSITEPSQR